MKNKNSKTQYYGGRIKPLVEAVAKYVAANPELGKEENFPTLHGIIARSQSEIAKGYSDREHCFNCARSMRMNVYTAGVSHALLLLEMAKAVREEVRKGIDFTHANRVHIDRLPIATSVKKQQSQAGYLGLIKPVIQGKRSGYWLITQWGWKALRGERIPKTVKYWDRKLIERSDETTTLSEMMRTHSEKISQQIRLGKKVKMMDHRSEISEYDSADWVQYGEVVDQSVLFNNQNHAVRKPYVEN